MNASPKGPLLQQTLVPIRWGDMDAMGHVNNILFLQYCEQCRVDWKSRIASLLDGRQAGMIVKKAEMTYHRPLFYPGVVEVRMFAGRVGRTSFAQHYELRLDKAGDTLHAEGEFTLVWFDYTQRAPAPIPDEVRSILNGAA